MVAIAHDLSVTGSEDASNQVHDSGCAGQVTLAAALLRTSSTVRPEYIAAGRTILQICIDNESVFLGESIDPIIALALSELPLEFTEARVRSLVERLRSVVIVSNSEACPFRRN